MLVFPQLHSTRLHLRQLWVDDIPELVQLADNPDISKYIVNLPYPFREPDGMMRLSQVVQGFKAKNRFTFAIFRKEDAALLGEISLVVEPNNTAQIGYWIGESYWGHGIATEAVGMVTRFAWDRLTLDAVFGICQEDNGASGKVLAKNGFVLQGLTNRLEHYKLERPK